MRIEASVTSVSWIPSEAVVGAFKMPFSMGMSHDDDPPPDPLTDIADLIAHDRCRFSCKVACVPGDKVDRERLQALQGHRREEG